MVAASQTLSALLGFQWLLSFEAAIGLILCTAPFVRVHRWVDVETRWLALWGFGNCLRVVKGSSFICHCSHCEEHFMPRESLALNPEICHKMLSANLLTSISFFCIIIFIVIINIIIFLPWMVAEVEAWVVVLLQSSPSGRVNLICSQLVAKCLLIFFQLWLSFYVK